MVDDFESIEFDIDDIVRSGLVRKYLLTKLLLVCNVYFVDHLKEKLILKHKL